MFSAAISRRKFLGSSATAIIASRFTKADQQVAGDEVKPSFDFASIRVDGDRFVDDHGRQVLLHGLSVISKSKDENYLSWHRAEDFAKMASWGMNCVRLGVIWDGVEPEPGKYDEKYLDGVAERVAWAAQHGIYVFLDMHQDLYSMLYSDGAPEWATLHGNKQHVKGAVWSDSYLISPAVQTAFDNFWVNAAAPDGVGLQDHYAAAWRHVAKRFAAHSAIIGYDIINEPFEGSSVLAGQMAWLQSDFAIELGKRLGKAPDSGQEIAAMWQTPDGRAAITKELNDIELYTAFVNAQTEHSQAFERKHLQPMYQRVANAIRQVDTRHTLMLETSYMCNSGIYTGVEPVVGADGHRDPNQAYVPHAYDIVVDTPQLGDGNDDRIKLILSRHQQAAERLRAPMIIGEWGAFGTSTEKGIVMSARAIQRKFEQSRCGDTYWDYGRKISEQVYFHTLKRSMPHRVAGELIEYQCSPETGEFNCRWKNSPDLTAPTVIYLTEASITGHTIKLDGNETGFSVSPAATDSQDVFVTILPSAKEIERRLTVN